eukprot:9550589-Ditylum_brightwellii.AAC.1
MSMLKHLKSLKCWHPLLACPKLPVISNFKAGALSYWDHICHIKMAPLNAVCGKIQYCGKPCNLPLHIWSG